MTREVTIINALKQEPCEDTISRQAVLASIKALYPDMPIVDIMGARRKWLEKYAPYFECENAIEHLPPVTPKQSDVLDKIRAEMHTTAEMHEDGDYYLRDEWIDEIIDKYKAESEEQNGQTAQN